MGGKEGAKRAVAIALRNRWRRQMLPPGLRDEVAPKNIIMIGPTGVGKTEIARRLEEVSHEASRDATREKLRAQLRAGKLDERVIEIDVSDQSNPMLQVFSGQGMEEVGINLKDMLSQILPGRTRRRRLKIGEA